MLFGVSPNQPKDWRERWQPFFIVLDMLAILKLITREFLAALSPAGAARQQSQDSASHLPWRLFAFLV